MEHRKFFAWWKRHLRVYHLIARSRYGLMVQILAGLIVRRHTIAKRLRAKLHALKGELKRRIHRPLPAVGKWLRVVLLGHYRYFGLPGNSRKLEAFKYYVSRLWFKMLRRRSQRHRLNWERMNRFIRRWLPQPRICRFYPDLSMYVNTRGRSPVR